MSTPSKFEGPGPIVLIVDDDAALRGLARTALEQSGLVVEEAENGIQALEVYQRIRPAVVLMDIMMPRMDGFAACAAIRRLPEGVHTPVLIVTGLHDMETITRAYGAGATDYVEKPWNPMILAQRVRYMLQASQASKALQESKASLARAQRIACVGSWQWDMHSDAFYASEEVYRILGMSAEESRLTYADLVGVIHPDDKSRVDQLIRSTASSNKGCDIECRIIRADGQERFVSTQVELSTGHAGTSVCVNGTILDITDRKRSEAEIQFMAYHDTLTLLPNRRLFQDRLAQALAEFIRYEEMGAVLLINMDRFQRINETLGYRAGDRLLRQIAGRLEPYIRRSDSVARNLQSEGEDTVSRFEGDEFTILLTRLPSAETAAKVAERVLATFANPFSIDGQKIVLTASIGISLLPYDGEEADTVLKHAEVALRHAKALGRNTYRFYTSSMNAVSSERLTLENSLRRALENNEFQLFYQPQVSVRRSAVIGAEALIRWRHPQKGLIPPEAFIPVAEEAGLITSIGEWVIRTACRQRKAWSDAGLSPIRVGVNLSAFQFRQPNLLDVVHEALCDSGIDAQSLEFELTEGSVVEDADLAVTTLHRLKERGLKLSIDDFGMGYSSLSYLHRLPIDAIKIDRAFVKGLTPGADQAVIIKAIIAMAQALNLRVLAEGVETEHQLSFLRGHGCDEIQGYLFSKPLPNESFVEYLQTFHAPSHRLSPVPVLAGSRGSRSREFQLQNRKSRGADKKRVRKLRAS